MRRRSRDEARETRISLSRPAASTRVATDSAPWPPVFGGENALGETITLSLHYARITTSPPVHAWRALVRRGAIFRTVWAHLNLRDAIDPQYNPEMRQSIELSRVHFVRHGVSPDAEGPARRVASTAVHIAVLHGFGPYAEGPSQSSHPVHLRTCRSNRQQSETTSGFSSQRFDTALIVGKSL